MREGNIEKKEIEEARSPLMGFYRGLDASEIRYESRAHPELSGYYEVDILFPDGKRKALTVIEMKDKGIKVIPRQPNT